MTVDALMHAERATEPSGMDGGLTDHIAGNPDFSCLAPERSAGTSTRPFWDVLGTWENARLEDHELRYLELKRLFQADPGTSAELRLAIRTARRVCGA